jgi:putative transposase
VASASGWDGKYRNDLLNNIIKTNTYNGVGRNPIAPTTSFSTERSMPNYRRTKVAGATYFFTVNLLDRRSQWLVERIDVLHEAIEWVHVQHPIHVDAWVVMPEHMHAVWTLPPDDGNYALRWSSIKRRFSKALPATERRSDVRVARGERGIWQRRFWEHLIRDDADYARHIDYIHYNPIKHGWVKRGGLAAFVVSAICA